MQCAENADLSVTSDRVYTGFHPLAANSSYYSKMVLIFRRQNFENLVFIKLKMTVVNQNKFFC